MRDIITVSLTKEAKQALKTRVKKRRFRGTSEYIRYLLEQDEDVITQEELIKIADRAKKDYKKGKLKKYASLADIVPLCGLKR